MRQLDIFPDQVEYGSKISDDVACLAISMITPGTHAQTFRVRQLVAFKDKHCQDNSSHAGSQECCGTEDGTPTVSLIQKYPSVLRLRSTDYTYVPGKLKYSAWKSSCLRRHSPNGGDTWRAVCAKPPAHWTSVDNLQSMLWQIGNTLHFDDGNFDCLLMSTAADFIKLV